MLSRTRRFAGGVAAALVVSAGIPATPALAGAGGPCQAVVAQSTGSEVAILLEGHFTHSESNSEVALTCHLVQNGVKVVSVRDPLSGPTAALASDQRLGTDPFYVCYTLVVTPKLGPLPADHINETNC